jgi:hypothetical protein
MYSNLNLLNFSSNKFLCKKVSDFLNYIVDFLPKDSGLDMIESKNKRKINKSWTGS